MSTMLRLYLFWGCHSVVFKHQTYSLCGRNPRIHIHRKKRKRCSDGSSHSFPSSKGKIKPDGINLGSWVTWTWGLHSHDLFSFVAFNFWHSCLSLEGVPLCVCEMSDTVWPIRLCRPACLQISLLQLYQVFLFPFCSLIFSAWEKESPGNEEIHHRRYDSQKGIGKMSVCYWRKGLLVLFFRAS